MIINCAKYAEHLIFIKNLMAKSSRRYMYGLLLIYKKIYTLWFIPNILSKVLNADVNGNLDTLKKGKVVCLDALYSSGRVSTPKRKGSN